jgi:hypothetical protein
MSAPLEITGYRAPLAVSCTDSATGAAVGDALQVTAWPVGDPGDVRAAQRSPVSTLLGFSDLPGLRGYELTAAPGSGPLTWTAAAGRPFLVSVTDPMRRYLPELTEVRSVPVTTPVPITLYSAPARPPPPGWAMVRGWIHTQASAPAAWSTVTVDTGTTAYLTLADEQGRFLCYLPYPEALPPLTGSPPIGPGLGGVHWQLTITVRYQPSAQAWPADGFPPELSSILGQAQAGIVSAGGSQPRLQATLTFGAALSLSVAVVPA